MQRSGKRGKYRTPYSRAPAGYSRARAQRRGAYRARKRRPFRPGYDRTGGFYGRFSGSANEMKFVDTSIDDAVIAPTLTVNNLTIIPEGNSESERIGRKLTIKKIHCKGRIELPAATAATSTSDIVICMLVQDTQTNGAAFTTADLHVEDTFDSYRNLSNSGRFKILWKKVYTLRSAGAAPSGAALIFGEDVRYFSCNVNCDIPIEYDNTATTGVITTVKTNNVYWCTQSSSGFCGLTGVNRLRYADR